MATKLKLPKSGKKVGLAEIENICGHFALADLWKKIKKDPPCNEFKSDGVSCFPDKIGKIDLYPAAFLHDLKYWAGYPGEDDARFIADCELALDVIRCGGDPALARLIFTGVRIGGAEDLPTRWRWAFGRMR